MEESEIPFHHKTRSYRIKQFEYPREQEHHTNQKSAQPSQPEEENVVHFASICSSITFFTFANIPSGGSISPNSSEQSILMKSGSSATCCL